MYSAVTGDRRIHRPGELPILGSVTEPSADQTRPLALITGGGTGIGAAIARRLSRDGFDVVVAGRRRAKLDEVVAGIEDGDPEEWERMFATNVVGTLRVIQAVLPLLRRSSRATIVDISSIAGERVYEGGAGYVAAKHGTSVVSECVGFVVGLPQHVNIDTMVIKPVAQAAPHKIHRGPIDWKDA